MFAFFLIMDLLIIVVQVETWAKSETGSFRFAAALSWAFIPTIICTLNFALNEAYSTELFIDKTSNELSVTYHNLFSCRKLARLEKIDDIDHIEVISQESEGHTYGYIVDIFFISDCKNLQIYIDKGE